MGFEVKVKYYTDVARDGNAIGYELEMLYADGWRLVAAVAPGTYGQDRELYLEREVRRQEAGPAIDRSSMTVCPDCGAPGKGSVRRPDLARRDWSVEHEPPVMDHSPAAPDYQQIVNKAGVAGAAVECDLANMHCSFPACSCPAKGGEAVTLHTLHTALEIEQARRARKGYPPVNRTPLDPSGDGSFRGPDGAR